MRRGGRIEANPPRGGSNLLLYSSPIRSTNKAMQDNKTSENNFNEEKLLDVTLKRRNGETVCKLTREE